MLQRVLRKVFKNLQIWPRPVKICKFVIVSVKFSKILKKWKYFQMCANLTLCFTIGLRKGIWSEKEPSFLLLQMRLCKRVLGIECKNQLPCCKYKSQHRSNAQDPMSVSFPGRVGCNRCRIPTHLTQFQLLSLPKMNHSYNWKLTVKDRRSGILDFSVHVYSKVVRFLIAFKTNFWCLWWFPLIHLSWV